MQKDQRENDETEDEYKNEFDYIKIIHILKAEIRAIGTETMKRIYGKELGYLKKTKVCRLKGFRAFWKKIMRNTYISTFLYNIF